MEQTDFGEVLIAVKPTQRQRGVQIVLWGVLVLLILLNFFDLFALGYLPLPSVALAPVFFAAAMLWNRRMNTEYEYHYVDGVFEIDRIIAQRKRKPCLELNMSALLYMAPEGDERLDEFIGGQAPVWKDYTSGEEDGENRYVMVYRDGKLFAAKVEPTPAMVKQLWRNSPNKVKRNRS